MANSIPAHMINEVMTAAPRTLIPEYGMLATYYVGSDRYAAVVIGVDTPKKIHVLRLYDFSDSDRVVRDGIEYYNGDLSKVIMLSMPHIHKEFGENAEKIYEYELDSWEANTTYTLRKNGRWIPKGQGLWSCGSIHLGSADPYLDPSF